MKYLEEETIFGCFEPGFISITASTIIKDPVSRIKLERDAELDLIFTTTTPGFQKPDKEGEFAAGTVRQSDDTIHFATAGGGIAIAKGVNRHANLSSGRVGYGSETTITYSAYSVEVDFQRQSPAAYVIEWVDNLPDGLIWIGHARRESTTEFTHTLGQGDAEITIRGSSSDGGGSNALHFTIGGHDLYLLYSSAHFREKSRKGKIVYKGTPTKAVRDKIRHCVSFILGIPIIYYGSTNYCNEWNITSLYSVSAMSIGGAMFKLYDQPPYPISSSRYANMIDSKAANLAVNLIYEKYDELKFSELSWSYWYAMCAPIHTSAVHFGGLVEKLQKLAPGTIDTTVSKLLDRSAWRHIQDVVKGAIKDMNLGPVERAIIMNKLSNINQAPQNLILSRIFDSMGLSISTVEADAWRHRNSAAHGNMDDNPIAMILNSKVLRILFHRLLAGITYCSDQYIDYYNLDYPVRPLDQAIPARNV